MNYHSFPKCAIDAFVIIGDRDFLNNLSAKPWLIRRPIIAKQRIYEKYITTDDIMKAAWLQKEVNHSCQAIKPPQVGMNYIINLLHERSNGEWGNEWKALFDEILPPICLSSDLATSIIKTVEKTRINIDLVIIK